MNESEVRRAMDWFDANHDAIARTERQVALAEEIRKENPAMSDVAAYIVAGDRLSQERADAAVAAGEDVLKASVLVGSYARLQWVVDQMDAGRIEKAVVLSRLPDLWRGSDPDDTSIRFLRLWEDAWVANGRHTILDGKPLPRHPVLPIFRGQLEGENAGIAWSLNPKIARKFALTGGLRDRIVGGVVYRAYVQRKDVLAYLTGRGESEVVVNPMKVFGGVDHDAVTPSKSEALMLLSTEEAWRQ